MTEKIGIVAWSQTPYEAAKPDLGFADLVYSVVKPLLQQVNIRMFDIDFAVTCASDFWDGRTISNMAINEVVGAYLRPESKVTSEGAQAVFYAMIKLLSGEFESALVTAHCKMSQSEPNQITWGQGDPFFMRPVGLDDLNAAALQARAYMDAYGVTEEMCAGVSVKNKENALANPLAQDGRKISVKDVMKSPLLSSPLKDMDRAPYSDGACALILATEKKAKQWTKNPVWIAGAGTSNDLFYLGDRTLREFSSLRDAAQRAYAMAGIQDPAKEIDVIEIADGFSYQELMIYEGLGLCEPGRGAELLAGGTTAKNGKLPVNPSGGMLGGCPEVVIGLNSVIEAAKQLTRRAGETQVADPNTGLVQGKSGFIGQQNTVLVLKNSQTI